MKKRRIDFRYAPQSVWTSICHPDDPYKTLVREDGALLYGFKSITFESWFFERVFEFSLDGATQSPQVEQSTESARVPVVVTTLRYPQLTLELRAFGHKHDGDKRSDIVLWKVQADQELEERLTAVHLDIYDLGFAFTGRNYAPIPAPANIIFAVPLKQLGEPDRWAAATQIVQEDETQPAPGAVAFISTPHKLTQYHTRGFRPCTGLSTERFILKGGESIQGAFIIPLNHQEVQGLDEAWAHHALTQERQFWQGLQLMQNELRVPDEQVMDMLIASARNILQAREIEDGLPVYKVGPTVYRNLFVVDGHFLLEAVQYLGDTSAASQAINTLLRRVRPTGAIYEMEHHAKETSISIATLVRQTELLGDTERLKSLWDILRNAVGYVEELRNQAYQLPPDDPCYKLMPKTFGDGGVGGDRGEYTTTFWTLIGLRFAADAAQYLGYEADYERFETAYQRLMDDFRQHAAREMRQTPDGLDYLPIKFTGSSDHHWIPDYPGTVPEWHRLRPQSATWAFCQAIYPGEIFSPDDPLVQNLLTLSERTDDVEGIPAETGWLPYKAVWNYHASFAAHAWLYAGRPDKAVDYLYDFANHASPTRVWREEQSFKHTDNGQLFGDMPHNWASAEFIRLVRHLLVFERGSTLELLAGLPPEWMHGEIVVERTPTRFGFVSLQAHFGSDNTLTLSYQRHSTGHREPSAVKLFLPPVIDLTQDGQSISIPADGVLSLAGSAAQISARLKA